eukprot:gene5151-3701_t
MAKETETPLSALETRAVRELDEACRSGKPTYSAWTGFKAALSRREAKTGAEGVDHYVELVLAALKVAAPARAEEMTYFLGQSLLRVITAHHDVGSTEWLDYARRFARELQKVTPLLRYPPSDAAAQESIAGWMYEKFLYFCSVLTSLSEHANALSEGLVNEWLTVILQTLRRVYCELPTPQPETPKTLFNGFSLTRKAIVSQLLHWGTIQTSETKLELAEALKLLHAETSREAFVMMVCRVAFEALARTRAAARHIPMEEREKLVGGCCVKLTIPSAAAIEAAESCIQAGQEMEVDIWRYSEFSFTQAYLLVVSFTPPEKRSDEVYDAMICMLLEKYDMANSAGLELLPWRALAKVLYATSAYAINRQPNLNCTPVGTCPRARQRSTSVYLTPLFPTLSFSLGFLIISILSLLAPAAGWPFLQGLKKDAPVLLANRPRKLHLALLVALLSSNSAQKLNNAAANNVKQRDRRNWFLYQLFVRQEYASCLSVIESQLRETGGACEYALYLKGLLRRHEGKLTESLALLQAAVLVNPLNVTTRKQLGRGLMLLGQHKEAIEAFEEVNVRRMVGGEPEDWETFYCIGVCHVYLKDYGRAMETLVRATEIQGNEKTFIKLAEVFTLLNDEPSAIETYQRALNSSPESPQLLALLGQQYLKRGEDPLAFDCLGRCLAFDPGNAAAITSAASMIQQAGDYDVALSKYRVAVSKRPNCPHIWNNIGACFYGKKKYYAALACLRKAQYLRPFEWMIHYNCGLVHLSMGRYVSAFHSLSTAINLYAHHAPLFMYLGVCLSLMNDIDNACAAYEHAIALSQGTKNLFLCRLNYAVTLFNSNVKDLAKEQFLLFLDVWNKRNPDEIQDLSPHISFIVAELSQALAL